MESNWILVLISLVVLGLLLVSGMHIAAILGLIGLVGGFIVVGIDSTFSLMAITFYRTATNFVLIAIPLFVLMAQLLMLSGASNDLFDMAQKWFAWLPGGLAIISIFVSAVLAAMIGVSIASIATVGLIAIPQMIKNGYSKQLAAGAVSAGGTLAVLIPPSIQFILIGWITEQSVGKLFMAGVVPGIVLALLYATYILLRVAKTPSLAPMPVVRFTWKDRMASLKDVIIPIVIIIITLGSIYAGVCTPTESAAIGALCAFLLVITRKWPHLKGIGPALANTAFTTGTIMLITTAAMFYGQFLTITGASQKIVALATSLPVSGWFILIAILIFLLFLGCILDTGSIILITSPIIFPMIVKLGFDPLWFSVLLVINMEVGLMTPPVGVNIFVLRNIAPDIGWGDIIKGNIPFVGVALVALVIMALFPDLSLWLPNQMVGK